jgi:hypothetical protein
MTQISFSPISLASPRPLSLEPAQVARPFVPAPAQTGFVSLLCQIAATGQRSCGSLASPATPPLCSSTGSPPTLPQKAAPFISPTPRFPSPFPSPLEMAPLMAVDQAPTPIASPPLHRIPKPINEASSTVAPRHTSCCSSFCLPALHTTVRRTSSATSVGRHGRLDSTSAPAVEVVGKVCL